MPYVPIQYYKDARYHEHKKKIILRSKLRWHLQEIAHIPHQRSAFRVSEWKSGNKTIRKVLAFQLLTHHHVRRRRGWLSQLPVRHCTLSVPVSVSVSVLRTPPAVSRTLRLLSLIWNTHNNTCKTRVCSRLRNAKVNV